MRSVLQRRFQTYSRVFYTSSEVVWGLSYSGELLESSVIVTYPSCRMYVRSSIIQPMDRDSQASFFSFLLRFKKELSRKIWSVTVLVHQLGFIKLRMVPVGPSCLQYLSLCVCLAICLVHS